jgi:glycosyltransferase involved in cell wall biosynthesis
MVSFAVVVPMYNEQAGAENCVRTIAGSLRAFAEPSQLIVVDDGSADGTAATLETLAPQFENLRVIRQSPNQGYGRALRAGAEAARAGGFRYTVFMDSDLTNHPRFLPLFVAQMRSGFDLIKASRYMPGGGVDGVPWWRYWISRFGNALAARLYGAGIHDCTNGFRAVRSDLFCALPLRENRFPIIMEELYYAVARGWRIAEVPNRLGTRDGALRPTSFSYRPTTFWRYLKYPCRSRWERWARRWRGSEKP